MVSRKSSEEAREAAISKTKALILLSFVVALLIVFGTPRLFNIIYSSSLNDAEKNTLTTLTQIALALFWIWFSPKMIESTVSGAINTAAGEGVEAYKAQHPDVEKIPEEQAYEYVCRIPEDQQSEDSVKRKQSICDRKTGRDAVIRSLSYNEDLLFKIATRSSKDALLKHQRGRTPIEQAELKKKFINDIYVYLRGWLMTSIEHDCMMPISYIRPRYPNESSPNTEAYIEAFKTAQMVVFPHIKTFNCMNEILQNNEHTKEAIKLVDEYLGKLIDLLVEKDVHPE